MERCEKATAQRERRKKSWDIVVSLKRRKTDILQHSLEFFSVQNKGTKAGAHKVTIFTPEALEKRWSRSPSPCKWTLL